MNESHGTHATILVGLFPSDSKTDLELRELLRTVQRGLKATSILIPPHVHCLYYLPNKGSYQFRLAADGDPGPSPGSDPTYEGDDIPLHLADFLKSTEVRNSITAGDKLYMLIGAHGKPVGDGTIAIVIRRLLNLFKALFSFGSHSYLKNVLIALKNLFRPERLSGEAFRTDSGDDASSITLTELANSIATIEKTNKPLQTLILHCCFLSSLEAAFELRIAEHHIACESWLNGLLDVSKWFDAMANNSGPLELTEQVFSQIPINVTGIFSSHWSIERESRGSIPEYIVAVNRLGCVLDQLHSDGQKDIIEDARSRSKTNNQDLVDVWAFSHNLAHSGLCNPTQLLALNQIESAILCMRIDGRNIGWTRSHPLHQGLSVYFPGVDEKWNPSDLPEAFAKSADQWKMFLEKWLATA